MAKTTSVKNKTNIDNKQILIIVGMVVSLILILISSCRIVDIVNKTRKDKNGIVLNKNNNKATRELIKKKKEEEKRLEEERLKEEERKRLEEERIRQEEESKKIINNVSSEYSTGIPVLNYHFFYNDGFNNCGESICLPASKLEEHLKYLTENGFKTLTMQEFVDWYEGRIEVPYKSVLITIDDGAMGTSFINGNILIPMLEKYQVHATLFLITAWWDKANYQSEYLDVESHGYDIHFTGSCGAAQLRCLGHDALYNDLKQSMDILGSYKSFCYPFYTASDTAYQVLSELGVNVAFGGGGYNATRSSYRYYIPRYPIYDGITMDQFINMVN